MCEHVDLMKKLHPPLLIFHIKTITYTWRTEEKTVEIVYMNIVCTQWRWKNGDD